LRDARPGELRLYFNRPQALTHQQIANNRTISLPWGRGVGKSFFLQHTMLERIAQFDGKRRKALKPVRGVRQVLMLPTFKQAKDLYASAFEEALEPGGPWGRLRGKINHSTWRISFPGGSWLQFFGATAVKTSRGLRLDDVFGDEVDDIDPGFYDSVISPWFSEPWSYRLRMLAGTPRRGRKGLLYRAYARATGVLVDGQGQRFANHFGIHATGYDTPETVSPEYLDEQRREIPPETFKREYLCDFNAAEGLVYSLFREGFHVCEPHPDTIVRELIGGIDHGWEDPAVLLVGNVFGSGADRGVHLVDEVYQSHQPDGWWIAKALELQRRHRRSEDERIHWYADPSRPDRIDAFRRAGLWVTEANNAIEDGVGAVQDALVVKCQDGLILDPSGAVEDGDVQEWSRLYVSPRCRNTIAEFALYRRKRDVHDREAILEDIEDKNNHCLAGDSLVLTHRGDVPIRDVVVGDLVQTRSGWHTVEWSGQTFEAADLWCLETSDGRAIHGTPDHRIWTDRGWVRLDALRYGDMLCTWANMASASVSGIAASCIDATPIRPIESCASTSPRSADIVCTETYGSTSEDPSHPATMCTIGTRTLSTTSPTISNACPVLSTALCTGTTSPSRDESSAESMRNASGPLPLHGIQAQRGSSGIDGTESRPSRIGSLERSRALNAARSSRTCLCTQSSAATLVGPRIDDSLESMTSTEPAKPAELSSGSIDTPRSAPAQVRVERVYALGQRAPVYDLTVQGEHEFFANGVLVHNSMDALRYMVFTHLGGPARIVRASGPGIGRIGTT
jgi:hypothetical protein